MEQKPRMRVNAKQTAKGEWYFDITAECYNGEDASALVLEAVQKTEKDFAFAGKKVVI